MAGFHLAQNKLTYSSTYYASYAAWGQVLLENFVDCILSASEEGDGGWVIDPDKTASADIGNYIYDLQTRDTRSATYETGAYAYGAFLKYESANKTKYLFVMITSSANFGAPVNVATSSGYPLGAKVAGEGTLLARGLLPVSMGAMVSSTPFSVTDLCDYTKNWYEVADTPLFALNGQYIYQCYSSSAAKVLSHSMNKLAAPALDNTSVVLGVAVKGDIIISLFRNSAWTTGEYSATIFGDILIPPGSDTKTFAAITANAGSIKQSSSAGTGWTTDTDLAANRTGYTTNSVVIRDDPSDASHALGVKESLSSLISQIDNNTNLIAWTAAYTYFYSTTVASTASGSRYTGEIDTDAFRACNVLSGSSVVLDGDFLQFGSNLIGWDSANEDLLS